MDNRQDLVSVARAAVAEGCDELTVTTRLNKHIVTNNVVVDPDEVSAIVSEAMAERKPATETPNLYLPRFEAVRASDPPAMAPPLVHGLLRRGHMGAIVAKAKAGKSWAAGALCVGVAAGIPWLGYDCERGRALYIDPELDRRSLDNRFNAIAKARGVDPVLVDERVMRWSLRGALKPNGNPPTIADIVHDLTELYRVGELAQDSVDLVVIDSCSALLEGDENASTDVRRFWIQCQKVATVADASVVCVHHEGKAASGDVDAANRGRGSSAWTDCPDVLLSLVELFPPDGTSADYLGAGKRAFRLEVPAIREFASVETRSLVWDWPLFHPVIDGTVDGWTPKSGQKEGGKRSGMTRKAEAENKAAKCEAVILAALLNSKREAMSLTEAVEACGACGVEVSPKTLKGYLSDSSLLDTENPTAKRCIIKARDLLSVNP